MARQVTDGLCPAGSMVKNLRCSARDSSIVITLPENNGQPHHEDPYRQRNIVGKIYGCGAGKRMQRQHCADGGSTVKQRKRTAKGRYRLQRIPFVAVFDLERALPRTGLGGAGNDITVFLEDKGTTKKALARYLVGGTVEHQGAGLARPGNVNRR